MTEGNEWTSGDPNKHKRELAVLNGGTLLQPGTPNDPVSKPRDLRFLASANFLMESLGESNAPQTPILETGNSSPVPPDTRRYLMNSLNNSPIIQPSAAAHVRANLSTRTQRPRSGIFAMDSSNYAILEDGSPVSTTPKRRSYIPPGAQNIAFNVGQSFQNLVNNSSTYSQPPRSPSRLTSPVRASRQYRLKSPVRRSTSPSKGSSPFNFQPQEIMQHGNSSASTLKPAHRKGHKYKHSSVSMNLFQEPPPAVSLTSQQLAIPDLYPIPNFKELVGSIKREQKFRLVWSALHVLLSVLVFLVGLHFQIASLSTLAHIIFYDSIGLVVIVFVDVMSNFEVWNSSSIAYPFGLGRLEVLVGFALGALLVMVGFDLVSHFVEEFIIMLVVARDTAEHAIEHKSHHVHSTNGTIENMWIYRFVLLISIAVTLITSNYILAYDRISKMILTKEPASTEPQNKAGGLLETETTTESKLTAIANFARVWSKNPTHLLTLCYSIYLLVFPFLPAVTEVDVNEVISLIVALLLCNIGWKLVKLLGGILMCSYPHSDHDYHMIKTRIMERVTALDFFRQSYAVQNFYITKFNYELYVVGIKLSMRGASHDDESRLMFEVNRIVKSEIEAVDPKNQIEITIDVTRY